MKVWWLFLIVLVGCSSSSSSGEPCQFEGTYSLSTTTMSGDCPVEPSRTVVDTITANGTGYSLEITGVQGACQLSRVGTECKLQGKCDLAIVDATDPKNATGTAQYSATFNAHGFVGTSIVTIPPAKSVPGGCSSQSSVTGTRQ